MLEDKDFKVSFQVMVHLSVRQLIDSFKAYFSIHQPTRVAVVVRGNSKYHAESDSVIIEHALSILEIPGTETLYLAREDWGTTIQLVFDVFHGLYEFNNAHDVHDMTVVIVSLGKRNEKRFFAPPSLEKEINKTIAMLHNLNGWKTRPPYFANHAQGQVPVYDSPRDVDKL
jgi:hypothetical protein